MTPRAATTSSSSSTRTRPRSTAGAGRAARGRLSEIERSDDMSDYDLERSITEELQWDPKLDSKAIAVSSYYGEVTLRGTVGSFREKRYAGTEARRVHGVRSVANQLNVRPLTRHGRSDADLRGAVLRA